MPENIFKYIILMFSIVEKRRSIFFQIFVESGNGLNQIRILNKSIVQSKYSVSTVVKNMRCGLK